MRIPRVKPLVLCLSLLGLAGCAPMIGAPSATLLSRNLSSDKSPYSPSGPRISDQDCFTWTMLFLFVGKGAPSHEAVLGRMLESNKADILLDAQFTNSTFGFPYIFLRNCAEVSGIPAVRKN